MEGGDGGDSEKTSERAREIERERERETHTQTHTHTHTHTNTLIHTQANAYTRNKEREPSSVDNTETSVTYQQDWYSNISRTPQN